MSLTQCWTHIKKRNPMTPVEFMRILFECKPDIDEHMIISWQRASRDWTTDIFEFVWFVLKIHQGRLEWLPHVQKTWPSIKSMIDTHCLDDLMSNMSI